jgi:hypothetical protein
MSEIISYKQVVDEFERIAMSHMAVKQFQFGMETDIDIPTDEHPFQRFPLVFMVPRASLLDRFGRTILGFSLIVADIAKDNFEDLQINRYNSTFSILQDILSKIILTSWTEVDMMVETPINIIPFQEAYNSNLTGFSAEIDVIVKSPFNLCDAAFE